jgi:hypothetical protein
MPRSPVGCWIWAPSSIQQRPAPDVVHTTLPWVLQSSTSAGGGTGVHPVMLGIATVAVLAPFSFCISASTSRRRRPILRGLTPHSLSHYAFGTVTVYTSISVELEFLLCSHIGLWSPTALRPEKGRLSKDGALCETEEFGE